MGEESGGGRGLEWHSDNQETKEMGGFPAGSAVKNPPAIQRNAGDAGLIPESGRSPGEGNGHPLQNSCLGNPRTEELGGLQSMELQKKSQT